MIWVFLVLIVLSCVILGVLVLVQNSKGGGLAGSFSGFNTQLLGVKKTSDVLENGTWLFAAIIAVLCLTSSFFIGKESTGGALDQAGQGRPVPQQQQPNYPQQGAQPGAAQQGGAQPGGSGTPVTPKP